MHAFCTVNPEDGIVVRPHTGAGEVLLHVVLSAETIESSRDDDGRVVAALLITEEDAKALYLGLLEARRVARQ